MASKGFLIVRERFDMLTSANVSHRSWSCQHIEPVQLGLFLHLQLPMGACRFRLELWVWTWRI
jgi:hypothetical protein